MSRLIETAAAQVDESTSPIGFETPGGATPKWHRYLTINGDHAYEIGNVCNTCAFFFERKAGAVEGLDVGELAEALETGLRSLDRTLTSRLAEMLPAGSYETLLLRSVIRAVKLGEPGDYFVDEQMQNWGLDGFWGLPHSPRVPYYRAGVRRMPKSALLFEFVIPMYPRNWLNADRVQHYRRLFDEGREPTAVAVSVLDIKQPADSRVAHWCLAHYVLDGHHKLEAASLSGRPMTLISFLATTQGVSSSEEIRQAIAELAVDEG
ncbi:MAG TPA: hypothetical protein VIO94_15395 [Phenylobacterium sp.]